MFLNLSCIILESSTSSSLAGHIHDQTVEHENLDRKLPVWASSGRTITIDDISYDGAVSPFILNNAEGIFVNDVRDGDKVDILLRNHTFLLQNGYLQRNAPTEKVRIIILPGSKLPNYVYKIVSNSVAEIGFFSRKLEQYHGRIVQTYGSLPFIVAELPYEKVGDFAEEASVAHVFCDQKCFVQLSESVPIIKPPEVWQQIESNFGLKINGSSVKIAVLDTGIDESHPDLNDLDDNPATNDPKVIAEKCFTDEDHTWDGYGHGTHCASIAAGTGQASTYTYVGVAPGAFLLNGKVLTDDGWGYESWIISGIEWAMNNSADVISMSFGANTNGDGTDAISLVVDWASDQGAVCVVAAGNAGSGGIFTVGVPGVSRKAVTVGATTKTDEVVYFSSQGPTSDYRLKPDVCAPGVDIVAARANGTSMGTPLNAYYTKASGTSMATPHVAGVAALLLQVHADWNPLMVKSALMGSAKTLDDYLWKQGAGRVDACATVNASLLIVEPSASFGSFGLEESKSAFLTLMNVANASTVVNVSSTTSCDGNVVNCTSVNVTTAEIPANSNLTVRLQAGPIVDQALGGWYEGWLNVSSCRSCMRCPYLFLSGHDTFYIYPDGSVQPPTAPIVSVDNITYTLTASFTSIADGIVNMREGSIIDGAGFTIMHCPTGYGIGIFVGSGISNVTIKNMKVEAFEKGVCLSSSSNIIIADNNIANNGRLAGVGGGWTVIYGAGIWLESSSDNSVAGNNLTGNSEGIMAWSSSYNVVSGNNIASNSIEGIWLLGSSDNQVVSNNISGNGYDGVDLYPNSYRNTVTGNDISGNGRGIRINSSSNNTLIGNDVTSNGWLDWSSAGILLETSSDNTFYHNTLCNNERHVLVLDYGGSLISENMWDNGYPSGGNYWSDYTGADSNHDGIGDTPYVIDSNNQDRYPLMRPWSPFVGQVAGLSDRVVDAGENEAYFVYADSHRMTRAVATFDVASGSIIYSICENAQNQGFDTNAAWVSQATEDRGRLLLSNKSILLFGGWCPNWCVDYLQKRNLTPVAFVAPVENGKVHFKFVETKSGEVKIDVLSSNIDLEHEDYFVMMTLIDENNNQVFIFYGFDWKGTWSAGIYFKAIQKSIDSYMKQCYIFHWIDTDEDGVPETSEIDQCPKDTISSVSGKISAPETDVVQVDSYFYVFYKNPTTNCLAYASSLNGYNWGTERQASHTAISALPFASNACSNYDIFTDGTYIYIAYDIGTYGDDPTATAAYSRRGTPDEGIIIWDAEKLVRTAGGWWQLSITKTTNRLYLAVVCWSPAGHSNEYDVYVYQSADGSSWTQILESLSMTDRGYRADVAIAHWPYYVDGIMLVSGMWSQNAWKYQTYNGSSWSAEGNFGIKMPSNYGQAFSLVAQNSQVHFACIPTNEGDSIEYYYFTTSWSSAVTVEGSTSRFPTFSAHQTKLLLLYIRGGVIYYRTMNYTTHNWDTNASTFAVDEGVPAQLTSEKYPIKKRLGILWMAGTSNPYELRFFSLSMSEAEVRT